MRVVYERSGKVVSAPSGSSVLPVSSSRAKPHILLEGREYKHCVRCGSWHWLSRFSSFAKSGDGLQAWCKSCVGDSIIGRRKKKIAGRDQNETL